LPSREFFSSLLEDDPDFNDDIPLEPKQVFSGVVPNHEQAWAIAERARLEAIDRRIEAQRSAKLMANHVSAKYEWRPFIEPRPPLQYRAKRRKA